MKSGMVAPSHTEFTPGREPVQRMDSVTVKPDSSLKTYMASRTPGCNYSMAHAAEAAHRVGMDDAKLEAVTEYRAGALFTEAERVALDFAVAAASRPNAVTDALFERMKQHWTDAQIVEITAAVALNGFLNRWSDTLAVALEPEPAAFGEKHPKRHGWKVGKHR